MPRYLCMHVGRLRGWVRRVGREEGGVGTWVGRRREGVQCGRGTKEKKAPIHSTYLGTYLPNLPTCMWSPAAAGRVTQEAVCWEVLGFYSLGCYLSAQPLPLWRLTFQATKERDFILTQLGHAPWPQKQHIGKKVLFFLLSLFLLPVVACP